MLKVRKILKKYYVRQVVCCWLVSCMALVMPAQVAMGATPNCTNDGGAAVAYNQGTYGHTTSVIVNQAETIMAWDNFNTAGGAVDVRETVAFEQGSLSNSAVLNRISGGQTQFDGDLTGAGMRIFMINPAGIVFGSTAVINVTQLVASSLNITDEDFLDGSPYQFTGGIGAENVTNEGAINAKVVALVGKNVINRGHILADESVIMAAGDTVLITENGSNVAVEVSMPDGWVSGSGIYDVKNEGENGVSVEGDSVQVILAAGDIWSSALLKASSGNDFDGVASIDIDAAGDVTVTGEVVAEASGHGESTTKATVTVNAGGDLDVITKVSSAVYASIKAEARNGYTNNAEVFICADNVKVEADQYSYASPDGVFPNKASIEAIADGGDSYYGSNTATVKIGAKKGVEVVARGFWGTFISEAWIGAEATNGDENKASVLICSQDDVLVTAEADGIAMIKSYAGAGEVLSEATTTVISHEGNVEVVSLPGGVKASIESEVYGSTGTATTDVYGKDVMVTGRSAAIMMTKDGYSKQRGDGYSLSGPDSDDGPVMEEDGDSLLLIDSSDNADVDCPDCPRDDEELLAPVAPLAQFQIPRIEGCPELMQAVAMELGITGDAIQVAIGNALALNPGMQPCEACATLVNAIGILRDEDGSRMAAMIQMFNTLAPADAPFTTEMAASIAMAFEGAEEGTQYASVMEYINAFVQYVAVLDIELGSPVGDSVAFVMEKYGADVLGSDNENIAAFIATRLAAIGG